MLWQRVLTALVLLPLMLGMLFYAPAGLWAFFTALMTLLALSEYSKLSGMNAEQRRPYLGGTALFMLFAAAGGWQLPETGSAEPEHPLARGTYEWIDSLDKHSS